MPTVFESVRYGWILYAERIFCRVLFSLNRSLNKTTVLAARLFFFPARHHKHAFKTTKDVSSNKLAYNILRVVVASAVREVSQKSQWKANIFTSGSINCGTNFLQIFLPTVFGERALPLYILKLPGRPRQGLSSIPPPKNTLFRCTYGVDKNDFCILQIFRWIPNLFEHKVHQNIICTSCKRYCIHIKKKSSIGIKPQLQSRC